MLGWPDGLLSADPAQSAMLLLGDPFTFPADLFLARMVVGVNEVTKNATVVLRRDPNTGTGSVLYFRVL